MGDGRVAAALIDNGASAYLGVDVSPELVHAARARLAERAHARNVHLLEADMLEPLPPATAPFEAAILTANTMYCTPRHSELIARVAEALTPGGVFALDVYNPLPWHLAEVEDADADDAPLGDDEEAAGGLSEDDLLVVVEDELGREWSVYERDPEVDTEEQTVVCRYDFHCASAGGLREELVHYYVLPEQLVVLLDEGGFAIERIDGDFRGSPFDPDASEHCVVTARRR